MSQHSPKSLYECSQGCRYNFKKSRRIKYTDITNHEQCDVFECGYHYFCNFVLTIFPKSYYREE